MNGTIRVPAKTIYLDSNVFIEMWEKKGSEAHKLIWDMFSFGMQNDLCFVSSELTLAEVLVDPITKAQTTADWTLVDSYRFHIDNKNPFQRIVPVSTQVLDYAANVRAQNTAIKLPDAIHLATALIEKCSILISNDQRFCNVTKSELSPKYFEVALTFSDLAQVDLSAWIQ
jgi:predicted nucleic acid-binding protein